MRYLFNFLLLLPGVLLGQEQAPLYYRMERQAFFRLSDLHRPLDLFHPDVELLDAAIFHATNEVREGAHLPPFKYATILYNAASFHARSMIDRNFYGHENKSGFAYYTSTRRIQTFGGKYHVTAENIAQIETLDSPYRYCSRKQPNGSYQYCNCSTGTSYRPYTYLAYARRVVRKWMDSPGHRANILNSDLTYMACAARLSRNPYRSKSAPFARPVQNFGGYLLQQQNALSRN